MIKINIDDKKEIIKEKHKNDFGKDYHKITSELKKLNMYKNFYSYFIDKNSGGTSFDNKVIEHLLCVDSKSELLKIINNIESLINKDANNEPNEVNKIKKEIKKVFEGLFKNFSNRKWAYDFLQIIDCKVCPYCNRMYTYTVSKSKKNGGTRPELDHYYSKDKYPYLAISIFNLIPSCSICNKGKSDTGSDYICYPYEESFDDREDKISFTTDFVKIEAIFSNSEKMVVKLNDENKRDKKEWIDKYNSCFKIDKLYEQHDDYARELIQKAIIFDDNFIESIYNIAPQIFNYSYKELRQAIFSNYLEPDEMSKRPLSKMTQDILAEFYNKFPD